MNVKIKTVFGELSFNMTQDNALALISAATKYAEQCTAEADKKRDDMIDALCYGKSLPPLHLGGEAVNTEKAPNAPPADSPAPKSRVEKLFGAKADWKLPTDNAAAPAPEKDTESGAEPEPDKYQGFLYIECEKCGTLKGFCIKHPIDTYKCECGHVTILHNLLPAHVKCECNRRFKYYTNIQSDAFTIECLNCGSPADMELGGKGTAFVSVAFSEMYKQKGTKKR